MEDLKDKLKHTILQYISKNRGCTFIELVNLCEREYPELKEHYDNEKLFFLTFADNCVGWIFDYEILRDLFNELFNADLFEGHAGDSAFLCYMVDGGGLNLPIAKKMRPYKTKRWLPVTFSLKKAE
jgi:hypothetical protein